MARWIRVGLGTAVGVGLAVAVGSLVLVIVAERGEGTAALEALAAAKLVAFCWTWYCVRCERSQGQGTT